ncbi:hypothetical protein CRENBAI_014775 [Crenichthys baileyi]|uniref:Dynein regulatory complex subunit 7 MORN domain-containing protein n=1 Tax=Crenichthys baileyi TaxID=28760 RepID=A0AAV9QX41_9TELE
MEPKVKSVFEEQVGAGKQKENRTNVWKLEEVEEALSNVQLPEELHPASYRINSPMEDQLLEIADNFQHQYLLLYPDRKPLLLVGKFVSTTLRPTQTGLWELQSWQDCSSFVADFLTVQPLEPPTEVPSQLFSPTSVLHSQKVSCFESSTLLCSLLLGLNYDVYCVYCVSGYASREMCLLDQSLQQCPLLDMEVKSVQSEIYEQKHQEQKYGLRGQRQLRSHFLKEQEKKKQEAVAALLQEKELQEVNDQHHLVAFLTLRLHVPLQGLRLPPTGQDTSIKENFFIDPLTGSRFPTNDDNFHGIENVWNNFNYYVNRKECINGCRPVETVLHNGISQQQLTRAVQRRQENRIIRTTTSDSEDLGSVESLSQTKTWWRSFPGGRKVTRYRKAKLERFSPTVTKDGLVSRLTTYKDLDCTEVTGVKEWYKKRSDGLEERYFNKLENSTAEHFKPGRTFAFYISRR